MRKAVAAAFGAALLGAGTSAVVGGGAAHGQLNKNKTGSATSSQKANAAQSEADADGSSASVSATQTLRSAVGAHQRNSGNTAKVANKVHGGNSSAHTQGSAKSGGFKIHIG